MALSLVEFLISGIGVIKAGIITVSCSSQYFFFLVYIHNIDVLYSKIRIHKDDITSKHLQKNAKKKAWSVGIGPKSGRGVTELTYFMFKDIAKHCHHLSLCWTWDLKFCSDMWFTKEPWAKCECEILGLTYRIVWQWGQGSSAKQHCWSRLKTERVQPGHQGSPGQGATWRAGNFLLRPQATGWEQEGSLAEAGPCAWTWPRINQVLDLSETVLIRW